jgi:hypothetical protein
MSGGEYFDPKAALQRAVDRTNSVYRGVVDRLEGAVIADRDGAIRLWSQARAEAETLSAAEQYRLASRCEAVAAFAMTWQPGAPQTYQEAAKQEPTP